MKHCNDYITEFMKKIGFPIEAQNEFLRIEARLDNEKEFGTEIDNLVNEYMYSDKSDLRKYLDITSNILTKKYNENEYTLHEIFLLNCTEILFERYKQSNISETIFWDTMSDLKYKLMECIECEHVWGTFVAGWNDGFFKMKRFALGRFQYEPNIFTHKGGYLTKCGYRIEEGDKIYGFHIPSSGVSLTDEIRLDSYKKAYNFYKDELNGGPLVLCCGSWLLYPKHKEFLPSNLNIIKFMDDFEIISEGIDESFHNDWRIFGHWTEYPLEQWPEDTALRKAYKTWLMNGNTAGDGYGVIIFDGEKILR